MSVSRGQIAVWVYVASLIAGSPPALSCGFEDPSGAAMARGVLNWAFPDALHVTSAVWRAQLEGVIGRNEEVTSPVKTLYGYQKAAVALGAFRDGLSIALRGAGAPAFSMVLIGPMLWSRYEPAGAMLTMTSHANGPSSGDVVIITDEPVVGALLDGRITPQEARELGLVRFYGSPGAVQDVTSWFERLPQETRAIGRDIVTSIE